MVESPKFDVYYYTYSINNIGQYVITRFKIRACHREYVETLSGYNIPYSKIFYSNQHVGEELDKIEKALINKKTDEGSNKE